MLHSISSRQQYFLPSEELSSLPLFLLLLFALEALPHPDWPLMGHAHAPSLQHSGVPMKQLRVPAQLREEEFAAAELLFAAAELLAGAELLAAPSDEAASDEVAPSLELPPPSPPSSPSGGSQVPLDPQVRSLQQEIVPIWGCPFGPT